MTVGQETSYLTTLEHAAREFGRLDLALDRECQAGNGEADEIACPKCRYYAKDDKCILLDQHTAAYRALTELCRRLAEPGPTLRPAA